MKNMIWVICARPVHGICLRIIPNVTWTESTQYEFIFALYVFSRLGHFNPHATNLF